MNTTPQWRTEFDKYFEVWNRPGIDGLVIQPKMSAPRLLNLEQFINEALQQERQRLIEEFKNMIGQDEDIENMFAHGEEDKASRNEFREELRQKLDLLDQPKKE